MAELTHSKRTDVIKSALAVYHWFVRQALTGGRVIARKPTGEEVTFETAELSALEGKGNRLSPEELGLLAKELAAAADPIEAARIKERLTRGFYGIWAAVPKVRRQNLPPALFQHLLDRIQSRKIPATQLELLATWLDTEPDVPEGEWYKRFSAMTVCGDGELIKTFLLPGQAPKGKRVR
jgi:hypothetical protein